MARLGPIASAFTANQFIVYRASIPIPDDVHARCATVG